MNTPTAEPAPDTGWYRIRVKGHLAGRWATRFAPMTLSPQDDGSTLIQGPVVDQAALHGLLAQIRHAPAQSTLSLAAIVAGVSLMAAMAIMVTSFRGSLDAWLEQVLPADLYVRAGSGSDTAWIPPALAQRIAALEGVAHVEFLRSTSLEIVPAAPRVTLLARDIDRGNPAARLALIGESVTPGPADPHL